LVINYELLAEEAEKIVKDLQEVGVDTRKADQNYLEMAKNLYGEYGSFSEKISYQEYFRIIEIINNVFEKNDVQVDDAKKEEYCSKIISIIVKNCSKKDIETRSEFFFDQIKWFIKIVIKDHWSNYCEHFSMFSNTGAANGYNHSDKEIDEVDSENTRGEMNLFNYFEYQSSSLTSEQFSKIFPYDGHEDFEETVVGLMSQNGIDQDDKEFIRCFVFLFTMLAFKCSRDEIISRSKSLTDYINVLVFLFLRISTSYELYDETTEIIGTLLQDALKLKDITTIKDIDSSYIEYLISWQQENWNSPPDLHYDSPLSYGDYIKMNK